MYAYFLLSLLFPVIGGTLFSLAFLLDITFSTILLKEQVENHKNRKVHRNLEKIDKTNDIENDSEKSTNVDTKVKGTEMK